MVKACIHWQCFQAELHIWCHLSYHEKMGETIKIIVAFSRKDGDVTAYEFRPCNGIVPLYAQGFFPDLT